MTLIKPGVNFLAEASETYLFNITLDCSLLLATSNDYTSPITEINVSQSYANQIFSITVIQSSTQEIKDQRHIRLID